MFANFYTAFLLCPERGTFAGTAILIWVSHCELEHLTTGDTP